MPQAISLFKMYYQLAGFDTEPFFFRYDIVFKTGKFKVVEQVLGKYHPKELKH